MRHYSLFIVLAIAMVGCHRPSRVEQHRAEKRAQDSVRLEEQIRSLYRQVAAINKAIEGRPEGERFATSAEADVIGKLSKSIKQMETEVGIADVISVMTRFIEFLRPVDLEKAKDVTRLADAFIKSIL